MTGPSLNRLNARVFPWHELERLPREVVSTMRHAARAVRAAIDERKLAQALAELVGDRVAVRVVRVVVASSPTAPLPGSVRFALSAVDDSLRIELDLDVELARAVVARVLGRAIALGDPNAIASPELLGATCAVVAAVARRAHGELHALVPMGPARLSWPEGERRLRVDAAVLLGADAYQARATVEVLRANAAPAGDERAALVGLGAMPIALPVVVAQCCAAAEEVFGLARDDIWLPGATWTVDRKVRGEARAAPLSGRVLLSPPGSDRGIAASLAESGELVVLGVDPMPLDEPPQANSASAPADTATSEVVLDAPLIVRVELGAVTMSAREWATLAPGDVITVGRRVAEPVALRVAGVEVARGELVDVEGELGVRIRERVGAGR